MTTPWLKPPDPAGADDIAVKVPEVTAVFWVMKVVATTLGETAGDAVTMSMALGYLTGTLIFTALFLVIVFLQVRSRRFHGARYWATIVATTTLGTTLADFADRSLGIGYAGGSLLLLLLLAGSLVAWRFTLGSIAIETVKTRPAEIFYWVTIMFSQTLGTALGDWTVDSTPLGYTGAGILFGLLLALVFAIYLWRPGLRIPLFWTAFILTRPLGAVLGDFLDKPLASGGLELDRYVATAVLAAAMLLGLRFAPLRAASSAH